MSTLLDFNFLVILNLFVAIGWPASGAFGVRSDGTQSAGSIIMIILTVAAIVLDILFMAANAILPILWQYL